MAKNLTLTYTINLAGNMQRQAVTTAKVIEQAAKSEEKALKGVDQQAVKTGKALGKIGSMVDAKYLSRDMDGVTRSTQQANQALERVGRTTFSRTLTYMSQLSSKLDNVKERAQKTAEWLMNAGKTSMQVGAGIGAAGMVLKEPVKRAMDYESNLAHLSNTVYADKDAQGRIAGQAELRGMIDSAVKTYGGSQEEAANAVGELVDSGKVSLEQIKVLLPELLKTSKGTGASLGDVTNASVKAMQTMHVKAEEITQMFDTLVKIGHDGGNDMNVMIKSLPQQMAAGGAAGMRDVKGVATIAAANQIAMQGTADREAANASVSNLLGTIRDKRTSDIFANTEMGNGLGVDLQKSLIGAQKKGHDPLTAYLDFISQVTRGDKKFAEARKMLSSDDAATRQEGFASINDQLQNSRLGEIFRDRNTGMATAALLANRDKMAQMRDAGLAAKGEVQTNYDTVAATSKDKADRASAAMNIAEQTAMDPLSKAVGQAAQLIADYAAKYPALTTAMVGVTDGFKALAAAGLGSLAAGYLLRGGKGKAAPGGMPGVPGMPGMSGAGGAIPVYVVNDPYSGLPGSTGNNKGGAQAPGSRINPNMVKGGALFTQLGMLTMFADALGANEEMKATNDFHRADGSFNMYQAVGNAQLDRAKGLTDASQGDWLSASSHLSIGELAGAAWDKMRGRNPADGLQGTESQQRINAMATAMNGQMQTIIQEAIASTKDKPQKMDFGQGQLNVNVAVRDDRTDVTTTIMQQLSNLQINAGATYPGGAGG